VPSVVSLTEPVYDPTSRATAPMGANLDRKWSAMGLGAVLAALAAVPYAAGGLVGVDRATGTLQLGATLRLESTRDSPCPPGTRAGVLCPARSGAGLVRGLGRVTESYTYFADPMPPSCSTGLVKIYGYPVRWTVAGKGEIHFAVSETGCLPDAEGFTADQSFTITGGSGRYAGASGAGQVDRSLTQTATGAVGPETWGGMLNVPGLEFDLTPPTIRGSRSKTVRAPRGTTRVRVRYTLTARDGVDASVPVTCKPASGSRFKIGRKVVRCTATDTSANTATSTFPVTVRRG
jgi:hypothetical protein